MDADETRRALRTGFDDLPDVYDRTRPVLPVALFDDLMAHAGLRAGSRVVEIGCATGQATLPLAQRGVSIVAIDLGRGLVALARSKLRGFPAVSLVASSFEDWRPNGECFDAVVAVSALHWVDPQLRYSKPATLLRPGGALVVAGCRWAAPANRQPFLEAVQEDYRAVGYPGDPPPPVDSIGSWHFPDEATALFSETFAERYPFTMTLPASDYLAHLSTQADTRGLGAEVAQEFLDRVERRMEATACTEVHLQLVAQLTIGRCGTVMRSPS